MAARILKQRRLGNGEVFYLDGCNFTTKETEFTIVGSESTGPGVYDVTHTIKNIKTGAYAPIEMKKLIQILLTSE